MFTYGIFARRVARHATGVALGLLWAGRVAMGQPAAPPPTAGDTPLSLADALREADTRAFANRIATATRESDDARARLPLKGILPSLRVESGVVRTTDPIGAFGTTLRQRLVTPAAFDPARLNDPAAVTNVQGGLVVDVPLINLDAWAGRSAALAAAQASRAAGDWTAVSTRANVVRAYYGAVLASEKVHMLEQAQLAAAAAARDVQSMVAQGLVTKADALQANVRHDDIAAQLISVRDDALSARQQLALVLGRRDASLPTLPTVLPDDAPIRAIAERDTMSNSATSLDAAHLNQRADVRAAHAGLTAAAADRARASAALLPRVNSFARYDWNTPTTLFGGRKNWTVGVMASWSLFGGGSELADMAGAAARERGARAGEEAARAQTAQEADAARRAISVALQRLDLAAHAAEQSREAQRLVEKRYVGGLATIAELLSAESSATGAALMRSAARYALIDVLVAYRRAIGADPAELAQLDTAR